MLEFHWPCMANPKGPTCHSTCLWIDINVCVCARVFRTCQGVCVGFVDVFDHSTQGLKGFAANCATDQYINVNSVCVPT